MQNFRLYGSYVSLEYGRIRAALEDFSGGLGEQFDLENFRTDEKSYELYQLLWKSQERCTLMGCEVAVHIANFYMNKI